MWLWGNNGKRPGRTWTAVQRHGFFLSDNRWPHFVNIALGSWLFTQPLLIAVQEPLLRWSEMVLGILLI